MATNNLVSLKTDNYVIDTIVKSKLFATDRETTEVATAQAFVKARAGAELGLPPILSQRCLYIIKGNVILTANALAALIKLSGRYDYRVAKIDNTECVINCFSKIGNTWTDIGSSSFSWQDALSAGLPTGGTAHNWKHYPRNMLFARAITNAIKWFMPDLTIMPVYHPDEMGMIVNDNDIPIDMPKTMPTPAESESLISDVEITMIENEIFNIATRTGKDIELVTSRIKSWCERALNIEQFNQLTAQKMNVLLRKLDAFETVLNNEPAQPTQETTESQDFTTETTEINDE